MKHSLSLCCLLVCFAAFSQTTQSQQKPAAGKNEAGDISVVKFNKSGNHLLVGYDYGKIELWELGKDTNKIVWSKQIWRLPISSLNFADEINQVVMVNKGGGIAFLDALNGNLSKTFVVDFKRYLANEPEQIMESDYNTEQNILALSGNVSGRVLLIDILKLYKSKKNSADSLYILSSAVWKRVFPYPEKSTLVYETKTNDLRDGAIIKDLVSDIESVANDNEIITCIKIHPTLQYVLAGTKAGKLLRWSLRDSVVEIFPNKILQVNPTRDQTEFKDILGIDCRDSIIVSVSFYSSLCGQMQVWNTPDLSLETFNKNADPSTCRRIKLSSDSKYAITTGDLSYRIWKSTGSSYELQGDLMYTKSVGYSKKFSSVDFWKDQLLAVGELDNVYIYKAGDWKYLKNLRMTSRSLRILPR